MRNDAPLAKMQIYLSDIPDPEKVDAPQYPDAACCLALIRHLRAVEPFGGPMLVAAERTFRRRPTGRLIHRWRRA